MKIAVTLPGKTAIFVYVVSDFTSGMEIMMKKEILSFVKEKRTPVAIAGFAIVVAAMMACGDIGLHVSLVALSVLVMLEALMAVMLHKVELWIHGVMVIAQIIAGVFTSRAVVSLLCVLVYAAAVAALWVLDLDS